MDFDFMAAWMGTLVFVMLAGVVYEMFPDAFPDEF